MIVGRLAIKHGGGGRMDIDGLRHRVNDWFIRLGKRAAAGRFMSSADYSGANCATGFGSGGTEKIPCLKSGV